MPFTLRNLKEDLEDLGPRFDGARDLEFRLATEALGLEQSGLGYQRVPPGYRFPYGHTHEKQEEVYVVLRGSGRMKLDDETVELEEWDAVRVPPGTWRGYEAGAGGPRDPRDRRAQSRRGSAGGRRRPARLVG
ncbi:MAG TPA: cupin domain-containing protein [Solirubrobacterales bacterium]|nr:cupin domain-containing protein [Solirubrobacterales bacterium]